MTALVMVAFAACFVLPLAAAKWVGFGAAMVVLLASFGAFGVVVAAAFHAATVALATS